MADAGAWETDDMPTTADVRARIAAGATDQEIRVELGLSEGQLEALKSQILREELLTITHRPASEIFVDYRIRMTRIANDLHDVSCEARGAAGKNLQAAVGALKSEATILDRIITTGQELGVLPRAAKTSHHTVVGGIVLGTMTTPELLKAQKDMKGERSRLKGEYGDQSFLDIADPDIYEDSPEEEEAEPVKVQPPTPPKRQPKR